MSLKGLSRSIQELLYLYKQGGAEVIRHGLSLVKHWVSSDFFDTLYIYNKTLLKQNHKLNRKAAHFEASKNTTLTQGNKRILKSAVEENTPKESTRKWRSQWEETTKGAIIKEFFSKCRKETGSESKLKSECNNNYDRPWKYSVLLTSIKNYRKSRLPMQKKHKNRRPSDIPVQKAKERKRNTEVQCT